MTDQKLTQCRRRIDAWLYLRIRVLLTKLSPIMNSKFSYRIRIGKSLNLSNPQTLNEKMMWLKLFRYNQSDFVALCSDKYRVRDYVKSCGCGKYLVNLLGVFESVGDIRWNELPNKFVLKWNFGSGFNIVCHDKTELDTDMAKSLLRKWGLIDYSLYWSEMQYRKITKKIICEQFLETADGRPPKDYKIFCSYGEPKLLFVASDRYEGKTKFDFYTPDWQWIPVRNGHPNAGNVLRRPPELEEMLNIARALSAGIPIVRIDLYLESGRIYFGEITFTHFACVTPFEPADYDLTFGRMFPIDSEICSGKDSVLRVETQLDNELDE